MTLSETVVAIAKADAALDALISGRMFPTQIPASVLAPLLLYFLISGSGHATHDDAATDPVTDLKTTQIQFTSMASTPTEAKAICAALHTALHAGQGASYQITEYSGPRASYEQAANLHRCDLDLTFIHSLAV